MQEEKSQNKSEKKPLFCQMCYEDQTTHYGKILTINFGGLEGRSPLQPQKRTPSPLVGNKEEELQDLIIVISHLVYKIFGK